METCGLPSKIKKNVQDYIINYADEFYKNVLIMKTKNEEPIPYQVISLPDEKKELWIYDKVSGKMLKASEGAEVLVISDTDKEGYVKTFSNAFAGGYVEIELKYIKEIGYN